MIPYKTLEVYLEKVTKALGEVEASIAEHKQGLKDLERQEIAINAQIATLQQLMDVEENPPVVELPFAGPENIEDRFNSRLDTYDRSTPEEVYQNRQDKVYRPEAMETVEVLDEANRTKSSTE